MVELRYELSELRKYFQEHPGEFPKIPGQKYFAVQLDSEGNKVKSPGPGRRVRVTNGQLKIIALPEDARKMFVCWPLE
jgi:hypothetical protein